VCELLQAGNSQREVAKTIGCDRATLSVWLSSDDNRAARARDAKSKAAELWDERAEEVLADADNPLDLAKARELASHYRWRASKIAPKLYGERSQVDVTATLTISDRLKRAEDNANG
jgi:transposase-like protein